MRNARVFLPQSSVLSAETTFALAPTFSLGETESSRSRNTRSALLATAFSIMRSLLAGVDNSDRLKRMLRSFRKTYLEKHAYTAQLSESTLPLVMALVFLSGELRLFSLPTRAVELHHAPSSES